MKLTCPCLISVLLYAATFTLGADRTTGKLTLQFDERSPLTEIEEALRRTDNMNYVGPVPEVDKAKWEYQIKNESFDVVVPAGYKQGNSHGLFVWMGVTEPPEAWYRVLARHKLIFITANNTARRNNLLTLRLPVDGVHNMKKRYDIDEKRVYVAGFSAGGAWATQMVADFPDVFTGGLFMMGGSFYAVNTTRDGAAQPTVIERVRWKAPVEELKKNMRLVVMRGEGDTIASPAEGAGQVEALLLDGFVNAHFIEVPRGGHNNPSEQWFEQGILALYRLKPHTPPTTAPTTQPKPEAGQIAQAQRLLTTGLPFQFTKRAEARRYLQQILDEYPTTPSAKTARELLKDLNQPSSRPSRPK